MLASCQQPHCGFPQALPIVLEAMLFIGGVARPATLRFGPLVVPAAHRLARCIPNAGSHTLDDPATGHRPPTRTKAGPEGARRHGVTILSPIVPVPFINQPATSSAVFFGTSALSSG